MKVAPLICAGMAAIVSGMGALAWPSVAAAQGRDPVEMLGEADANRDGSVSWAEVVSLRTRSFQRLDQNKDGFVSSSDRPFGPFGMRFDEAFVQVQRQFDANSDGRVSRAEMINAPAPAFSRGDVNRDGILSAQEWSVLRATPRPK